MKFAHRGNDACPHCQRETQALADMGRALAARRKALGLTQETVSRWLGVSAASISAYEHGRSSRSRLALYAKALETQGSPHEA